MGVPVHGRVSEARKCLLVWCLQYPFKTMQLQYPAHLTVLRTPNLLAQRISKHLQWRICQSLHLFDICFKDCNIAPIYKNEKTLGALISKSKLWIKIPVFLGVIKKYYWDMTWYEKHKKQSMVILFKTRAGLHEYHESFGIEFLCLSMTNKFCTRNKCPNNSICVPRE